MAKLCLCQIIVLITSLCFGFGSTTSSLVGHDGINEQVCEGTSLRMTKVGDAESRYQKYKHLYTNCTFLVGNLEIIFLEETNKVYDLSFLSNIKEITGYLLLVGNIINYVPLTNLRIIRGETLYSTVGEGIYGMFIVLNNLKEGPRPKVGLKQLQFISLTEILRGRVFFQDNNDLCFENTIDWTDINTKEKPPVEYKSNESERRKCPECDDSCWNPITQKKHCWGEGPNMCQTLSHVVCHENCGEGRCYGSQPNECCHPQCAGGCTGQKTTDCFACRNLLDEGACVSMCPRDIIYDPHLMMKVKNPNVKYAFGSICVKKCPSYMLQDDGFCVRSCSENKHAADGQNCKECNGPCPRTCPGIKRPKFLHAANLADFEDCTSIDGSLPILKTTFSGDPHFDIPPLHPSNLSVLKNVREITEFLLIQSDHPDFKDLSFLSNLEIIQGRNLFGTGGNALNIISTPLQSMELTSLKQITHGNVLIMDNINMCYADTVDWNRLFRNKDQESHIIANRNREECEREQKACDPQCGSSGCWGKGPNKCLSCANFVYEEQSICLNKCSDMPLLYHKSEGKCHKCHSECANTCSGPNNTDCDKCAHVIMHTKDNKDLCEPECPISMYPDGNSICRPCHPFCSNKGCTGPNKRVGDNGCRFCDLGIRETRKGNISCIDPDKVKCEKGYFMAYFNSGFNRVCEICHELCSACSSSNTEYCSECRYIRSGKHCVGTCPNSFFASKVTKSCEACNSECRGGCHGPSTLNCTACANFKIYTNMENNTFNCTPECPADLPYQVKDNTDGENRVVCADNTHPEVMAMRAKNENEERKKLEIIIGVTIPGVILVMAITLCCVYFAYKKSRNNKKAAEYTAKITGHEEIEPLTPTSAKPDLAKMLIINESDLRRGAIIGSGAFGTVYKGVWMPQGENVKIPVAIKVLQEGNSPTQSTELLNEARVMCSVEHMCCVRILAVCMSSQMMLITQLMPHGCLLEYVRENKAHIGSKVLLDWCTQIARGMSYLEERSIVHRDLAARNVLVQTPNQVKITDFGLAKLLDYEADEYHATGGLMPIKWLALECIQHRIFTHKSDVWSYGVTVWELFTLGKKPYDGIRTREVPMMLEKGERLQQPIICTIDVYMIMVKCWMLESDSRPSFKELAEEFAKMSRDPGRYLVIKGDTLMRLPSVSYDKEELIRGLSECPGDLVEADDYLQPNDDRSSPRAAHQHRIFDRQHSNSPQTPLGSINEDFRIELMMNGGSLKSPHNREKREKKYAHLSAAARAKQERQLPRGDSVSSRYSSDPITNKDKGDMDWPPHSPMNSSYGATPRSSRPMLLSNSAMMADNFQFEQPMKSPSRSLQVDEDNYLQPKFATAAYVDLNNKGYYQNEKAFGSTQAEPIMLDKSPTSRTNSERSRKSSNRSKLDSVSDPTSPLRPPSSVTNAVANPEYFDGRDIDYDEDDDVWEPKKSLWNGYQQVPNGPSSPLHSSKEKDYPYYNDVEQDIAPVSPNMTPALHPLSNTRQPSESMV